MPSPTNPNSGQVETAAGRKKKDPPKRRGPKGYFQGSRREFLESQLSVYSATRKGNRQNFWHNLYSAWWIRYPWRLDDDDEPPTGDPSSMARLAAVAPGDAEQKGKVEKRLSGRLSQWFANHAGSANNAPRSNGVSDWLPLLQQLHRSRNACPRQRTVVQQFMLEYPGIVQSAFAGRCGDGGKLTNTDKMNVRYDVARTLVNNGYSHLKQELEKNAVAQHIVAKEEWNLMLDDISSAKDVSLARDSLFDAVHPLLQAIGNYAGCYVSLIAGNPEMSDDDEGFFTAVHWWPGDRSSVKDWTQWDKAAFNSGVAGPFLAYMTETNQLLQVTGVEASPPVVQTPGVTPPLVVQTPGISPPPALPGSRPIVDDTPSAGDPRLTHVGSSAVAAIRHANYRPLPTKKTMPISTKKRKYAAKSQEIRFFQDKESEDDEPDDRSGDGSSSGDSVSPEVPAKRQRKSRIATRSSVSTPAPDVGTEDTSLQLTDAPAGTTDVEPGAAHDTNIPSATDTDVEVPPTTNAEINAAIVVRATATTTTDPPVEAMSLMHSSIAPTIVPRPPSPLALSSNIDVNSVPEFLLSHGKGKRKVNIFRYLNGVDDPRFRQILSYYISIEANDRSGVNGSLPTAKRPSEISQWSSRARPASLPEYAKGKRTFTDFVDSVLTWWGSIQPPWRTFERGSVSREIHGDWSVLYAPRINGLLNVVMLAYWWIRILREDRPEGGIHADYERFADDVVWVFSHIAA